jgi:N12 class adenine-specific DNA methylase
MNTRETALANLEAIKILKSHNDLLTATDRQKLLQFTGWGACANVFDSAKQGWEKNVRDELQTLLTEQEYEEAIASTFNAHYTTKIVIEAMWEGLMRLGLGGKINALEPGCGIGRFLEYAPTSLNIDWIGVERDIVPAQIASLLHPNAQILNQKFQDFQVQKGEFDLVIGNVPFGDIRIKGLYIHNYFIKKAVDLTREGGFIVLISSTGTLDSLGNEFFRRLLSEKVDLVGAMRLPNTTFQAENTSVTTDILVFKKVQSTSNRNFSDRTWILSQSLDQMKFVSDCKKQLENLVSGCGQYTDREWYAEVVRKLNALKASSEVQKFKLSGHYLCHPNRLLGRLSACELYGSSRMALSPDDRDIAQSIVETFESFTEFYDPVEDSEPISVAAKEMSTILLGQFFWREDRLFQRQQSGWEIAIVDSALVERVTDMIELYEVLNGVIEAQKLDDEENLIRWRSNLNICYDKWFKKFGCLNAKQNIKLLEADPRYYLLMALEKPSGKNITLTKSKQKVTNTSFEKADIFYKRTASPKFKPTFANSTEDAIIYSLNEFGKIDVEYIAGLRKKTESEIAEELSKGSLAYFDPAIERWVLAEEYLSGNVRKKLNAAIEADNAKNIEALKLVQPLYLLPQTAGNMRAEIALQIGEDICNPEMGAYFQVKFGCTWIDPSIYGNFATFLLGHKVEVIYDRPPIAAFGVIPGDSAKSSKANKEVWGTPDFTFLDLLEKILGQKDPIVRRTIEHSDGSRSTYTDEEATEIARAKISEIKQAFQDWLWQDLSRAVEITKIYNRLYNCYVSRKYNGEFLELPGCNPDFKWRPHQKNAIWRGITSRATLLAHCVGAGKTAVMIATIMELRRLGLAKKPMLAVLPSTLPGVVGEFQRLYPHAKLKIAFEKALSPENRKRFCTEIATGDWDCVIITHTQFRQGIALSPEMTLEFLQEEKRLATEAMEVASEERQQESVKRAAKTVERIDAQIAAAVSAAKELQDEVIYLEQTGIDALFFDESQVLKNLPYHTRRTENIAGLPNKPFHSKRKSGAKITSRAFDAYMKIRWLQANGRPVVFATGTPVSNSLAEAWTMMRYLAMPMLEEAGIEHFDACLAAFFNITSVMEQTPTGYKIRTRCRGIDNIQEFMTLWRTFVDIQSANMLQLPVPNHKIIAVDCPSSPDQLRYMDHLIHRLENMSGHSQKGADNPLVVYGDARLGLGIDLRLRWAEAGNFLESKLNACAVNVFRIWQLSQSIKATQAIFFDFTSPKGGGFFDPYNYTKDALVALGTPAEEIAFIHDYDTAVKRKKLYAQVNAGEIRVVLGSTETLGTGVNIQRLLFAIHQMVCPWRPSDIEQQTGRILRQNNLFESVLIFRYVTQGQGNKPGFDSYIWGVILSKLESFNCLMSGEFTGRSSEDLDPFVASAATMMAIASGDERIKRQIDLGQSIKTLSIQKNGFEQSQYNIKLSIKKTIEKIDQLCETIPRIERDLAKAEKAKSRNITIGQKVYPLTQKEEMAEKLLDLRDQAQAAKEKPSAAMKFDRIVGNFAGFELWIDLNSPRTDLYLVGEESYKLCYSSKEAIYDSLVLEEIQKQIKYELEQNQDSLKNARLDLESLNNQTNKLFPKAEELALLIAEKAYLDEQLNPANQAPIADEESSTQTQSEDDDENFIPFGNTKSPCIYTGVENHIVRGLQQILKNTTPEWVPDAIASFEALAQKLKLEETFLLSIDESNTTIEDTEDDSFDIPDDFFDGIVYDENLLEDVENDSFDIPDDFFDRVVYGEDSLENTENDLQLPEDFWNAIDFDEDDLSDEMFEV